METPTNRHEVKLQLAAVRAKHCSWSAHRIKLLDGVYTIGPRCVGEL
jgi:hypothetical protein